MRASRYQLALDCEAAADDILAFLAQRTDAPPDNEPREAYGDPFVAVGSQFEDDFAIQFGERLQHLLIRLTDVGYGPDALDPLTHGGTSRLGARSAAETLHAISKELGRA